MFLTSSPSEKFKNSKFLIGYSKLIAKGKRKGQHKLVSKLKFLEKCLSCGKNLEEYQKCMTDLNKICNKIAKEVNIRSKCQWYEESENQQNIS